MFLNQGCPYDIHCILYQSFRPHLTDIVVMAAIDGISWISWEDVQGTQGYCCTDTCHFCGCPHTPQWARAHYPTSLVHKGSTAHARCKEFWVVFCSDVEVLLPEMK